MGRGYVRRVTFENLMFHNVKNPIIIDQNYCNVRNACEEQVRLFLSIISRFTNCCSYALMFRTYSGIWVFSWFPIIKMLCIWIPLCNCIFFFFFSLHNLKETGVQISDVIYRDVAGTSASKIAINLNCSKSVPCYGILMESMQLTSAITGREVAANCSNAYGREEDAIPGPCLRRY